jgi:hypothetical protein
LFQTRLRYDGEVNANTAARFYISLFTVIQSGVAVGCGSVPPVAPDATVDAQAGIDAFKCPGHDEDGDGWNDDCDNCPTIANPDQRNDGELVASQLVDALGDVCDPRPALSGDRIAFVEYFNNGIPSIFDTQYSGVVAVDDAVRLGGASSSGFANLDGGVAGFTRAEFAFRVDSASATEEQWAGLNIFQQTPIDFAPGIFASGPWTAPGPLTFFLRERVMAPGMPKVSTGGNLSPAHTSPYVAGEQFQITVDTEGVLGYRAIKMVTTRPGDSNKAISELQEPRLPASSYMMLQTHNVGADFQYIIIYAK